MARFFDVYHYDVSQGRYIRDDDDDDDDVIMTLEDAEALYNDFCNDNDFAGDNWAYLDKDERNRWLTDNDFKYDEEKDVYISDGDFEYEYYDVATMWAQEDEDLQRWFYTDWLPDFMREKGIHPDNELKIKIEDFKSKKG